jgi:hypothetical protein
MNRKEKKERRKAARLDKYNEVCANLTAEGFSQSNVFLNKWKTYVFGLSIAALFVVPLWVYYRVNFYATDIVQPPCG